MEDLKGPRRTGIFPRLCRDFAMQARRNEPDYDTTTQLVKDYPWISSHPWSENGIPETLEGQEFSIIKELREEYALTLDYDPDFAQSYEYAANDFTRLYKKQQQDDLTYLLKHGTAEQKTKLMQSADTFFEEHFENTFSPYYGTYAPITAWYIGLLIRKDLEEKNGYTGPSNI